MNLGKWENNGNIIDPLIKDKMINGITNLNKGRPFDINLIKNPKIVYVIPSYNCNLHCPHCTIWKRKQEYNPSKIYECIKDLHNTEVCLFGGEILLNDLDFLNKITNRLIDNKCNVIISSNLVTVREEENKIIENDLPYDFLKKVGVGTSYNPGRFNTLQFNNWISNLKKLRDKKIRYTIMVTLTSSLSKIDVKVFDELMNLNSYIDDPFVKFDNFIGPLTDKDVEDIDNWLVNLYDSCKNKDLYSTFVEMKATIMGNNKWGYTCNNVYTILPSGNLKAGCPYYEKYQLKDKCMECKYLEFCVGGCCIQPTCTFPKKLFKKIKEDLDI